MGVEILNFKMLHGSTSRHILLRALVVVSALSVVTLMQIMPEMTEGSLNGNKCALNFTFRPPFLLSGTQFVLNSIAESFTGKFDPELCEKSMNLTRNVVAELMSLRMLNTHAKSLCIGQESASAVSALRELGFSDAHGVYRHPLFSFRHKNLVHELDFEEKSFDFVFSGNLEQVNSPALLVLEIERVLKPGGIGAVLVSSIGDSISNNLVKSATPVSSLLSESSIVHVGHVDEYTLVVFRRKVKDNAAYFGLDSLPGDCASVRNNKAFIGSMEPLLEEKPTEFAKRMAYLPTFVDISSKKRLVYIDIGAAKHLNANLSSGWFLPSYPIDVKAFNVYFVDHNTSIMLSYIKRPGITFVYHPGLAGHKGGADHHGGGGFDENLEPFPEDEDFDFMAWFEETTKYADFVVLKMNANELELKFLSELFRTGAICAVDELFLHCSNGPECMNIFKGLRNNGVFVHQWWGED